MTGVQLGDEARAVEDLHAELTAAVQGIRKLLSDKGEFANVCDDALEGVGSSIEDSEDLAKALTFIAATAGIDPVDEEEAEDMFLPNLTKPEFYHLARNYFTTLASALDLDLDDGAIIPAA
eukprot:TRINITY_DN8025_c0_g1_i1.p2 TRINITY_DN8025_c0_g1~~TRINITY_DN8025_c0_g1_i1.p2  ORF type:complete len:121 (+),score=58.60 TRINITY_DN8025_c0_g1_i1:40-402(+)